MLSAKLLINDISAQDRLHPGPFIVDTPTPGRLTREQFAFVANNRATNEQTHPDNPDYWMFPEDDEEEDGSSASEEVKDVGKGISI